MRRSNIRNKVNALIRKFNTTDPYELCDHLGIDLEWEDLGKNVMGVRTKMKRIPSILLNYRNTEREDIETCLHEIGHHCCGHNTNVEYLKRDGRQFVSYGVEYEANVFMVELLLHDANLAEHQTKQHLLNHYGIPAWAERYVDWEYLENTADLGSIDSCYYHKY